MTADIRFLQQTDWPRYAVELDWLLSPLNLIEDGFDLQSAVIVALGTDALAGKNDALPGFDDDDRGGWWGDMDAEEIWGGWPVGSKLWLLRRAKITSPLAADGGTVFRADSYTRAALNPFVSERIATKIEVRTRRSDIGQIDVDAILYRGPDPDVELRYSELWNEMLGTP